MYPYNDGEVAMNKVMSPVPWDSTLGEEGEYLLPREPPIKSNTTPQNILPVKNAATSTP